MAINIQTLEAAAREVSPEFIGKAHKIIAATGDFYLVENERGDVDEHGDLIEYRVELDTQTCSCKAGQYGFIHCKNGYCKHLLWATAAQLEETAAMAEMAIAEATAILQASAPTREHLLVSNGIEASAAEYDRVMTATPKPGWQKAKFPTRKPFSLMR